ncbi:MAG TPA: Ig-like domain-containing protein [Nitrosopumilaceae archaeon]|nr:Ig-like domain-containing protein [Nitrosopumilaceae archaeon]
MKRSQVEHRKMWEGIHNESTFHNFKPCLIVFVAVFGIIMVSSFDNSYADSLITLPPTDLAPINISYTYNYVYVTNYNSGTVSVINATSNNVVGSITVGTQPYGIAYNSNNGKIYVANYGSNNVSVIDPSSNTVISTISGVTNPSALIYDSKNQDLYVTSSGLNTVSVIDPSSNSVITTIPVGTQPNGIAYNSNNGKIYVANYGSNTISVIDTIAPDTTPPTLTILSPANNAMVTTAVVPVTGTSSDDTSVSSITWKVDSGAVSTATGTVNWSFTTPALSNGVHTLYVNATDTVGLVTQQSISITYYQDDKESKGDNGCKDDKGSKGEKGSKGDKGCKGGKGSRDDEKGRGIIIMKLM